MKGGFLNSAFNPPFEPLPNLSLPNLSSQLLVKPLPSHSSQLLIKHLPSHSSHPLGSHPPSPSRHPQNVPSHHQW
jgi:hypothetical protein